VKSSQSSVFSRARQYRHTSLWHGDSVVADVFSWDSGGGDEGDDDDDGALPSPLSRPTRAIPIARRYIQQHTSHRNHSVACITTRRPARSRSRTPSRSIVPGSLARRSSSSSASAPTALVQRARRARLPPPRLPPRALGGASPGWRLSSWCWPLRPNASHYSPCMANAPRAPVRTRKTIVNDCRAPRRGVLIARVTASRASATRRDVCAPPKVFLGCSRRSRGEGGG